MLQLFGEASGLVVNFTKSSATLLRCDREKVAPIIEQFGCPIVDMPFTYLGIPLLLRRPTAAQLQPLVDGIASRLPTWKAGLLQRVGRLALVKSVLSAIPVHQLIAYAPPKKAIKQIISIQRGFLWA
jgi:hypothetical protein